MSDSVAQQQAPIHAALDELRNVKNTLTEKVNELMMRLEPVRNITPTAKPDGADQPPPPDESNVLRQVREIREDLAQLYNRVVEVTRELQV